MAVLSSEICQNPVFKLSSWAYITDDGVRLVLLHCAPQLSINTFHLVTYEHPQENSFVLLPKVIPLKVFNAIWVLYKQRTVQKGSFVFIFSSNSCFLECSQEISFQVPLGFSSSSAVCLTKISLPCLFNSYKPPYMYPCKPDYWQRLNSQCIPGINTAITPIYSCISSLHYYYYY